MGQARRTCSNSMAGDNTNSPFAMGVSSMAIPLTRMRFFPHRNQAIAIKRQFQLKMAMAMAMAKDVPTHREELMPKLAIRRHKLVCE